MYCQLQDLISFLGSLSPFPKSLGEGYQCSSSDKNFISGLTTAEIEKAVQLAKKHVPPPVLAANPPSSNQIEVALPPALPIRPPPPPPRSRSWQEYVLMSIVIGGVGYAVVQFVRVSCLHIEQLTMNLYSPGSHLSCLFSLSLAIYFPLASRTSSTTAEIEQHSDLCTGTTKQC